MTTERLKLIRDALASLLDPRLEPAQVDSIVAEISDNHAMADPADVAKYTLSMLPGILERVKQKMPETFIVVPSPADVMDHLVAEYAKTHGKNPDAVTRMTLNRTASAMSNSERRNAMPPIEAVIGEVPAPAKAAEPKAPAAPLSVAVMNARIEADTGLDPRQMLTSDKRRYYDAYTRERSSDVLAASAKRDLEYQASQGTLTPQQRLTLARLQKN